jgi:cytochrome c peroxidase
MPTTTMTRLRRAECIALHVALLWSGWCAAQSLPPVPVPVGNPITEEKRILGKVLFWDEQLSADDTVACGTCHLPSAGGADPRAGIHPGTDAGTIDNVRGSPGIVQLDAAGQPTAHAVFGLAPQITPRTSPSNFGGLWADALFWDGRAGPRFDDPITGATVLADGGALENQALTALANTAEMAKQGHDWGALAAKLAQAEPLGLADRLPADVTAALARHARYPALFAAAYGDAAITPVRIALAIATYQRTLVADQTPWDRYAAGDSDALTAAELRGWRDFQDFRCTSCHVPPLFTNNDFANIGLRLSRFDAGRMRVTGDPEDAGEMKVPSLRNVGLRPRLMHTGQFATLGAAVGFYNNGPALEDRDTLPGGGVYAFNMSGLTAADLTSFLGNALTDPRVRDEQFPFDRPRLRSERLAGGH